MAQAGPVHELQYASSATEVSRVLQLWLMLKDSVLGEFGLFLLRHKRWLPAPVLLATGIVVILKFVLGEVVDTLPVIYNYWG